MKDICDRMQAIADLPTGSEMPKWLFEEGDTSWANGMSRLLNEGIYEIKKLRGEQPLPVDIIGEITAIRANNNELWMMLLKIALQAKPETTKGLLLHITENDEAVSERLKRLAE